MHNKYVRIQHHVIILHAHVTLIVHHWLPEEAKAGNYVGTTWPSALSFNFLATYTTVDQVYCATYIFILYLIYILLVACGDAPLSASLHEAVTPGQRTCTGRCFLPQHATCMQPSVCSVSQLASRGALCMQCRFRGALAMQCSSHGALDMQCSSRGALAMQCSSHGALDMQCSSRRALAMQCSSCEALAMHSLQSVHFACSAAFAGTFTYSAALSGHLPRAALSEPTF